GRSTSPLVSSDNSPHVIQSGKSAPSSTATIPKAPTGLIRPDPAEDIHVIASPAPLLSRKARWRTPAPIAEEPRPAIRMQYQLRSRYRAFLFINEVEAGSRAIEQLLLVSENFRCHVGRTQMLHSGV